MRSVGGSETKRNVLVDGNNLLHKMFHVFVSSRVKNSKPLMFSKSGYPIGLIYGFFSVLSSMIDDINNPTNIVVFFDGSPIRRRKLDLNYKNYRTRSSFVYPPDVVIPPITLSDGYLAQNELAVIIHALNLLGCDVYHHCDEEADDLIASYIKKRADEINIIVSDDKDFFQLVRDRTILYRPGSKHDRFVDVDKVLEITSHLYSIPFSPEKIHMLKSFIGDMSDGIPSFTGVAMRKLGSGVPEIVNFFCQYSSIEDALSIGIQEFPKKFSEFGCKIQDMKKFEKIKSASDRIRLNYKLVSMIDDIDLGACLSHLDQNFDSVRSIFGELNIDSINVSSFRLNKARIPVPMESWLLDI